MFLCEINYAECTSSKNAIFAIIGALDLVHFSPEKIQKFTKMKIQCLQNV